jgi:hypothetical protein
MFHRKASKFDITDHPDILAALARMEAEAYARGRADALAIARDHLEEVRDADGPDSAIVWRDGRLRGVSGVIERLEA